MPIGRMQQSRAMFYTLIVFVGLFLIAVVLAIVFYIKSEDYRKKADNLQDQIRELASSSERQRIGAIVGSKQGGKSRLGTMVDYLDETTSLILGGVPEETSAEVKVETTNRKARETLDMLGGGIDITGPNTTGLVRIIEKLKTKLDEAGNAQQGLNEQLKDLQNRFDDAMATTAEKEQVLLAEKEKLQQQANNIKQDYDQIKALLEKTTAQQVQTLSSQLDEERANNKKLHQSLLKSQAELKIAEGKMQYIQDKIASLVSPDIEASARQVDGKIMLIDDKNKIVHLNIGRDEHVYQGLTFTVYNRNMPIPKDGQGKAEIEIIEVGKTISTARIIRSEINKPIIVEDIVANLIWDRDKTNVFVAAGDFDLDSDGKIDSEADYKIKTLIEKWGGKVADTVSIETDFLVLGKPPQVVRRPSFDEMEADPLAMEKYNASVQRLERYKLVQSRAEGLSIPIFNYNRFLYLIGYKTQSEIPGAF